MAAGGGGEVVYCKILGLIDGLEEVVKEPGGVLQQNVALSKFLVNRLVETGKFLKTEAVCEAKEKIVEPLKALERIVTDANAIVRECCEVPWIPAAIRQAGNKEAFFEVLRDLYWCTGVVRVATVRALRSWRIRGASIFDAEGVADIIVGEEEEKWIRKKVDEAANEDMRALEVKLDRFISTGESGDDHEHVVIAKHLKSWFMVSPSGQENFSTLAGLKQGVSIGRGSFGDVFRCTWQGMEFAEKRIFGGSHHKSPMEEANVMRDARHPNVVRLVAKDDEECKLVLELMDSSLTDLIKKRAPSRFRLVEAVDILFQISKAILFLHKKRVAHRDIKSGNILYHIDSAGYVHVKVADFGLAKLKLESATLMSVNKGSRLWTAPELIALNRQNPPTCNSQGEPLKQMVSVDHALRSADVFSFGITCFEIVTGQTDPYGDYVEQVTRLIHMVAVEGLRPKMPDDVRKELVYLMEICWSQDPSRRPPFTYIYKFLLDFKAHLLTYSDSPFRYQEFRSEEWPDEMKDSRWSEWWSNFVGTLVGASGVVWQGLCAGVMWAISTAKLLFTTRFKSLEEITDRDVRSRQIPFQTLEAATVGGVSKNIRHVRLSKEVEGTVTETTARSEDAFLKGAFFLTQLEAHPNFPTLIGYSVHKNKFYLVHKAEAVKFVSLHDVMSLSAEADWRLRHELTWAERYNIALGVGQALVCIHQLTVPIIHGNLSSRNVMLAKGTYYPKLFKFYTSCMFPGPGSHSNFLTNDTRGWDAPEKEKVRGDRTAFAQDVYSFGVLLLVLVTDRNAFTASNTRMHVHIVDEAWEHFKTGKIRNLEGPTVKGDPEVVMRVLRLALHCVQADAHYRPTMAEAVDMLIGKNDNLKDSALAMFKSYSLTPPKTARDLSHPSSSSTFTRSTASDVSEKVGRAHAKQN